MGTLRNLVCCFGVLALPFAPSHARACSALVRVFYSSLPESGAQAVPIDIAPVIRGHFQPETVTWEADDGGAVSFELITGPQRPLSGRMAELVPREPLRPNTHYVIRASTAGQETESIAFTTGDSLSAKVPHEPPPLAVGVLDGITNNMCYGTTAVVCASVAETAALLEVLDADGGVLDRDVFEGNLFTYVTDPACVRVWARSASGQRSAPRELCGDALPARPVADELNGHYECREGEFKPRGGDPSDEGSAARAGRPLVQRARAAASPALAHARAS